MDLKNTLDIPLILDFKNLFRINMDKNTLIIQLK